ncbi:MAG: exo-beta-N-acetylmuramidase NamZ domain-containing protein, partial [Alphaproteobacteria bacterium]
PSRVSRVAVGGEVLVDSGFAALAGKRVGLITNQTGLARGSHLVDHLHGAPTVNLAAIFAPEHGFRGVAEAGEKVGDDRDAKTGVRVFSLYGATRKPRPAMLRGIDVLVFDIQDIGARYYTYISTMGLAMQAAAQARIPFVVLDRPNPLGGTYVSGFVLEPALTSFVGQYPIPIVHGLTVGELARMMKAEGWLSGLEALELSVIEVRGWKRTTRWPGTGRRWVATSPNIPTFESALAYPGIGFVGELDINEGRGTPIPFTQFGAPWLDGRKAAAHLNGLRLPGLSFEAVRYRPRAIPRVASDPRFEGRTIGGVRLDFTDIDRFLPLETGMHAMAMLMADPGAGSPAKLFRNLKMFHLLAGTRQLHRMLVSGASGSDIISVWSADVDRFKRLRAPYLIY